MGAPAQTLNPRTNANSWTYFTLQGVSSPGTIPRGGVKGFKRSITWDKKMGKGTEGATLTQVGIPPVKGSFVLQLIAGFDNVGQPSQDFANWDAFVQRVLSTSPKQQIAQGLSIGYPGLASIGLSLVVVESYSGPEHQGKNLYHCTIELVEWQQPPPKPIVKTVSQSAANLASLQFSPVEDPRVTAARQERDEAAAKMNRAANPNPPSGV